MPLAKRVAENIVGMKEIWNHVNRMFAFTYARETYPNGSRSYLRLSTMVLSFLMAVPMLANATRQAPFSGALTINQICERLQDETKNKYEFAANFSDHAVYFRLKDASPERLKQITAECLRGHWVPNGTQWRLISDAVPQMPDWFPMAWQNAYDPQKKSKETLPDPTKLYALRVGDQQPNNGKIVRRLLGMIFEWGQSQWTVENPLSEVLPWLGNRSQKIVKVPDGIKPKPRMGGSSLGAGNGRWIKGSPDPLISRSGELLSAIADTLEGETAMPIPDGLSAAGFFFERDIPLGQSLKALAQWMEFHVEGNVLIGQLSAADTGVRTQANRSSLLAACNPMPDFFDTPVLAKIEAEQPPFASIAMNDIMALMVGGASIDGSPHYPWDVRLYRSLSGRDWATLRESDRTVGDLSPAAQLAIDKLALKSRMIFEQAIQTENGIVPRSTAVKLEESTDSPFVMYYGDRPPEITDSLNVASQRIWNGYDDKVARYLPVKRRLLTVVIGSSFKVPFTKVETPADRTPVRFNGLPKAVQAEISKMETDMRNQRRRDSTPPPK